MSRIDYSLSSSNGSIIVRKVVNRGVITDVMTKTKGDPEVEIRSSTITNHRENTTTCLEEALQDEIAMRLLGGEDSLKILEEYSSANPDKKGLGEEYCCYRKDRSITFSIIKS